MHISKQYLLIGLIPDDAVAELLGLELPKRIVNLALGNYAALVESSFLDEIWRIRCNAVAEWEKEIGIDTAMKRSNPKSTVKESAVTDKSLTSRVENNKSKGETS
ncbi:6768_t:CDS:2, partial [Dentiscutata heterogama]